MTTLLKIGGTEDPNRIGDVVFVHGLNGDPKLTWSHGSEEVSWPSWLAKDCPGLGVWSIGYDVAASSWKGTAMPLFDRANNILAELLAERLGTKPLCFIAHSIGGLLVKQMLRNADSLAPEFDWFSHAVRGVIFLATPHTGSDLTRLANYLKFFLRPTVAVREVEQAAPALRELNLWYRQNADHLNIKAQVYFEAQKTKGMQVVDAVSADPGIKDVTPIAIDANHITIAKPSSKESLVYLRSKQFVGEVLLTPAEDHRVPIVTNTHVSANQQSVPTIGIITALSKEYVAMEILLENAREQAFSGGRVSRRYTLGEVPLISGGKQAVVLALLPSMGTNMAATGVASLLHRFPQVREIIMVGIAGGIPFPEKPDEHVRLGDIVVSDQYGVIQYDFTKKTTDRTIYRPLPRPPSANLLLAARHLEASRMKGERPWLPFIDHAMERLHIHRPAEKMDVLFSSVHPEKVIAHPLDEKRIVGEPRVFIGPIASANTLLKDPVLRDELREDFGIRAIEMEGAGIADATWDLGTGYLVIRGICDYCDSKKGDIWQEYAAIVAAAYTRALLASIPDENPRQEESTKRLNVQYLI